MKKFLCLISASLLIMLSILCACEKNNVENMPVETLHIGNLYNFGYVANDISNIYFVDYSDDDSKLVKSDLYGSNRQILSDYFVSYLNIYENSLYFIGTDSLIYKMNKDGTGKQNISDIKSSFILIYDGILYSISQKDNHLYKFDLSEETTSVFSTECIAQIYIYNDEIYYIGYNHGNTSMYLKKMNLDGSSIITLSERLSNKVSTFYVNDNGIYIINDQYSSIFKVDLKMEAEIELDSQFYSPPEGINQYKNYIIYYDRISKSLKYLNTDNNTISRVGRNNIYALYIAGDIMVIYDTNGKISFENLANTNVGAL